MNSVSWSIPMASVISVCNLKGGAGKSTVAVNLACQISQSTGELCLLVDADRQGTARAWGQSGKLPVPIVPMILDEAKAEERYPGMIWISQIKEIAVSCRYLIIDLPAGLRYSLAAVALVSDLVVVPVNPSGVDFHSTRQFMGLIGNAREFRGTGKLACVIVPNRIDSRTSVSRDLGVYEQFGERITPPIHTRKTLADAFDAGSWVGEIDPESASAYEFETLASAVLDHAALSGDGSVRAKRLEADKAVL
jgi:chromosome partitioning protein